MSPPRFRDRTEAGRKLAEALRSELTPDSLVLGLARGGLPVAREVAQAVGAELDVLVARKLGAPGQPEFGFGAVALHAEYVDPETVRALGLTPQQVDAIKRDAHAEAMRRERTYRGERPAPRLFGRTVVVVDDGVATGGTAKAALAGVRREGPQRVLFAAPVGPPGARHELAELADEVFLIETPEPFVAVGRWYDRFDQTSDDEVLRIVEEASRARHAGAPVEREVSVDVAGGTLGATLATPPSPIGLVIFAHGSGSSRRSPRNRRVAGILQQRGLATLLLDLLTPEEERVDQITREHRFNIPLLASRLVEASAWARGHAELRALRAGYFGSSTGGGAALVAAARDPVSVHAVVSRGGRPDLAEDALPQVKAPTLLIVGGRDEAVLELNEEARDRMRAPVEIHVVPGATHLFEEPGALEEVAGAAADWFAVQLAPAKARAERAASR